MKTRMIFVLLGLAVMFTGCFEFNVPEDILEEDDIKELEEEISDIEIEISVPELEKETPEPPEVIDTAYFVEDPGYEECYMPVNTYGMDCDEILLHYDDCLFWCDLGHGCERLVKEFELCLVLNPEESEEPIEEEVEDECEPIEQAYRNCANEFGPYYGACWEFERELKKCWFSVDDGWCDKLTVAYDDCVEQFGYYHYACNQFQWDHQEFCSDYYEWPYPDPCMDMEFQYVVCVDELGEGSEECQWISDEYPDYCQGWIVEDTDYDIFTDTDTEMLVICEDPEFPCEFPL